MQIELLTFAALIVVGGMAFVFGRFAERVRSLERELERERNRQEAEKAAEVERLHRQLEASQNGHTNGRLTYQQIEYLENTAAYTSKIIRGLRELEQYVDSQSTWLGRARGLNDDDAK